MNHTLPELEYSYDALEPSIDARTMEIHHTKHHQTYIDKLNGVLEKNPAIADMPLEDLLRDIETLQVSEADKKMIRNHGGGHANHSLFWQIMDPAQGKDTALVSEIEKTFGSVEEFKKQFSAAAVGHFGSGWAWLVRDSEGALKVYSLPNQDSPLMQGHVPILGLDVWEHAYYLKYQNRRQEYVEQWWKVIQVIK